MPTPTKTAATKRAYLKRAGDILATIAEFRGSAPENVTAGHAATWLEGRRTQLTAHSFRQYRAALVFHFSQIDPNGAESIRNTSQLGLAVPPKQGRTSSKKKKHIPPKRAMRLLSALRDSDSKWAHLAADIFEATLATGLRPVEWKTARIEGSEIVVKNAKATNGRGTGKFRRVHLTPDELAAAKITIQSIKAVPKGVDWYNNARVTFREFRKRLYPVSGYALYTARHQFSANNKAVMSQREVADRMGHKSERTAAIHYGKKRSAWKTPLPSSAHP